MADFTHILYKIKYYYNMTFEKKIVLKQRKSTTVLVTLYSM